METSENTLITVEATIHAPVEKVWKFWTEPRHIMQWNQASDDWHTPRAENDLRAGGRFLSRMEARDGSWGFDFSGQYNTVEAHKQIAYTLDDGRKVQVSFAAQDDKTTVTTIFEAEQTNPVAMQQEGWQAILNNFKKYVEAADKLETMQFEIRINASAEKVYRTMLDEKHYSEWTAAFNPASRFKGSWEKDAKIQFLGEDENGKTGGMVSRIKENIPNRFISIEHLGIIENDKEITSGAAVAGWAGALENYTFTEENGKTLLVVTNDVNQEYKSYFSETWPKALQKLKAICEA
jgi:uncharacterized protein YndB with AHSA1/START domain